MEVNEYCDNLTAELSGWKSKMDHLAEKFDHTSTGNKEKVFPEVNELHMIIDDLNFRIRGLNTACSVNWKLEKEDEHMIVWPAYFEGSWDSISVSDLGG